MTLYQRKSFQVPSTAPTKKTPCKIHHFVKGQCLRCPQKIVAQKADTEKS